MVMKRKMKKTNKIEGLSIVEKVLAEYPLIKSSMVGKEDLTVILDNLQKVLDSNIK
jgi:hypothetical protein